MYKHNLLGWLTLPHKHKRCCHDPKINMMTLILSYHDHYNKMQTIHNLLKSITKIWWSHVKASKVLRMIQRKNINLIWLFFSYRTDLKEEYKICWDSKQLPHNCPWEASDNGKRKAQRSGVVTYKKIVVSRGEYKTTRYPASKLLNTS